jgi:hypothetical protein
MNGSMRNGAALEDKQRRMRERQAPPRPPPFDHGERKPHLERQYIVSEIAEMWHRNAEFVRRIFERRPGVAVVGNRRPSGGKRSYTTLLISESILEEAYLELSNR